MSLESTAWYLARHRRVEVAEVIRAFPGLDVRKDVSRLIHEKEWVIDKKYDLERNGTVTYIVVKVGRVDFKNPQFDWGPYRDHIPRAWGLGEQGRLI